MWSGHVGHTSDRVTVSYVDVLRLRTLHVRDLHGSLSETTFLFPCVRDFTLYMIPANLDSPSWTPGYTSGPLAAAPVAPAAAASPPDVAHFVAL